MSNIAGKAYAMNLLTPVTISVNWVSVFFIPGLICLLKAGSYFFNEVFYYLPTWLGGVLSLAGTLLLLGGLLRWLNITSKYNEFVFWFLSLGCFIGVAFSKQNLIFCSWLFILGGALLWLSVRFYRQGVVWINEFIFWLAGLKVFQKSAFGGLNTLSLIHYARWVIMRDKQFPVLSHSQPKEKLKYGYMLFFSNFNGSWTQYVDSFSMSIPGGLNLLWYKNQRWPDAVPETPFNNYVISNQIWTEHYYNAYPLASSNDIKSAQKVKAELIQLSEKANTLAASAFEKEYKQVLLRLQSDLSRMEPTPVVSLAYEAIEKRSRIENNEA